MKNKHGLWQIIVGVAGVICGVLLIIFRNPEDSIASCIMPIWIGVVFVCSGIYMSTRTPQQYKKEFKVQDERTDKLNGKSGFFTFLFMQLIYMAAVMAIAIFARENMMAWVMLCGLVVINELTFLVAHVVYSSKM